MSAKPYLKPGDPDAFLDMPVKDNPAGRPGMQAAYKLCPTCAGHGGWHLALNQYKGPHPHFNASCSDCNGWGWITEDTTELPTARFVRIKALFQPVLQGQAGHSDHGRRSGTIHLTDASLRTHPDLRAALIYAANGWHQHNFGGRVVPLSGNNWEVDVYTD
jgi:hypothetical protein